MRALFFLRAHPHGRGPRRRGRAAAFHGSVRPSEAEAGHGVGRVVVCIRWRACVVRGDLGGGGIRLLHTPSPMMQPREGEGQVTANLSSRLLLGGEAASEGRG
jgi:hypothetical protein